MHTVLWLFAAVIIFTVLAVSFTVAKEKRRTQKMGQAAKELGLDFQPDGSALLEKGLGDLPVFAITALPGQGRIANLMLGQIDGVAAYACDSKYWTGNANTRRFDYSQTVVCFPLPEGKYPSFALHPAAGTVGKASRRLAAGTAGILAATARPLTANNPLWNAVVGAISQSGEDLIVADPFPGFSDKYRLTGSDRDAVRNLFSKALLESLLQYDSHPLSVECSAAWLAVYCKNRVVPAKDVGDFLRHCARVKWTLLGT